MRKKYLLGALSGVFCLALLGSVQAATISLNDDHGTIEYVDSLSQWNTTGLDMTGMTVKVTYDDTLTETVSWNDLGPTSGADGTGWSLQMVDPTVTTFFGSYWIFDVEAGGTAITSIFLDGFADNTVFDNKRYRDSLWSGGFGTVGSADGNPLMIDFHFAGEPFSMPDTVYGGVIDVTYSGAVVVGRSGDPVLGDVYRSMQIDFESGLAFTEDDKFSFYQDTDNVRDPVPEPATMLLFGIGLTGLVGMQVRRKKR